MSIHCASGGANGLDATSHLSNPQACTKLIWVKHDSNPSAYNSLVGATDSGITNYAAINSGSAVLSVQTGSGTFTNFPSAPTFTNWNCLILTLATAGANSANGYWQDNAGGGFVTKAATGVSFTNFYDWIGGFGSLNVGLTLAYYMEWSVVLGSTDRATQFLSATPVVQLGSLRRYLALTNAASAKTDTSGNGFNFDNILGSITDGATLPTFPASVFPVRRIARRFTPVSFSH